MERRFTIIGMDDSPQPQFTAEARQAICAGRTFTGGRRHREIVCSLLPADAEWIEIKAPMDEVFARYDEVFHGQPADAPQPIVVLASGDPLFFGIANTIRRRMPDARIRLIPWFNSLQTLAHRLLMAYDDMRTVSLTGRPWPEFDRALIERVAKIGILTDHHHTPDRIAARLRDYGYTYYIMYVGEHIGHRDRERIRRLTLEEAMAATFDQPNCVILHAETTDGLPIAPPPRPYGIADHRFELLDGRSRMITKSAIRLLTIQALELSRRQVMWDVGFCTGSVSIEARLQFPHLCVVAFEVRPEGERLMSVNARRFGAPGITALIGDFLLTDTSSLPRPDAIFIGGHGGRLTDMVARAEQCLLPGGCIVFNSVTSASREAFAAAAAQAGLRMEPTLHVVIDDYNPIDIMKAVKA